MSKLSTELEKITGVKSNICSCGRKIQRAEDVAKGMCRICNPFTLQENGEVKSLLVNRYGDNYPLFYQPE